MIEQQFELYKLFLRRQCFRLLPYQLGYFSNLLEEKMGFEPTFACKLTRIGIAAPLHNYNEDIPAVLFGIT
jgi:hypothetical protein